MPTTRGRSHPSSRPRPSSSSPSKGTLAPRSPRTSTSASMHAPAPAAGPRQGGAQALPRQRATRSPPWRRSQASPPGRPQAAHDGARRARRSDWRPSSPGSRHEVRLRRTPPGSVAGPAHVSGPAVPGVATTTWRGRHVYSQRPENARPRLARDQGHPRPGEGPLRKSPPPRRVGRPGPALLREHCGRADARAWDRRQDEAEVPRHDRLESRSSRGRGRREPGLRADGGR